MSNASKRSIRLYTLLVTTLSLGLFTNSAFAEPIGLNAFSGNETVIDFEQSGSNFADPLGDGTVSIENTTADGGSLFEFSNNASPRFFERVENSNPQTGQATTKANNFTSSGQVTLNFDASLDIQRFGLFLSSANSTGNFTSVTYTGTALDDSGSSFGTFTGSTDEDMNGDDGEFAGFESTTGGIETVTIDFSPPPFGQNSLLFDDIRFEAIPEPASLMLAAVGSLMLLSRRR